jgi:Glycosyl transferase family, helical bundle domain/Glutamine amidotransferase class-I
MFLGVQFHPESIKTDFGMKMLANFLTLTSGTWENTDLDEPKKAVSYISVAIRLLAKPLDGPISPDVVMHAVEEIMQGKATPAQISALLVALSIHGTSSEVRFIIIFLFLFLLKFMDPHV